jgi:hypothetical protein
MSPFRKLTDEHLFIRIAHESGHSVGGETPFASDTRDNPESDRCRPHRDLNAGNEERLMEKEKPCNSSLEKDSRAV